MWDRPPAFRPCIPTTFLQNVREELSVSVTFAIAIQRPARACAAAADRLPQQIEAQADQGRLMAVLRPGRYPVRRRTADAQGLRDLKKLISGQERDQEEEPDAGKRP
jgi:hypothetical protein